MAEVLEYQGCFEHPGGIGADGDRTVILEVMVPPGVPPGEQTVSAYGNKQLEYVDEDGDDIQKGPYEDLEDEGVMGSLQPNSTAKARVANEPNALTVATI